MTSKLMLPCKRLLAGVSGGADSVALLLLLLDAGASVTVVHVNHGLRGEASDGDEQFVRELCARLSAPLLTYRAAPPEHPSEGWAREARYGFFRQAMAQTGTPVIALAHHRDDQAETLLLHLLRGSGLNGLTAMRPDTEADGMRILRPLLGFSREELRSELRRRGQPWREDESNRSAQYLRNALRHGALAELERLSPGASSRLARTAELLAADEDVLNRLTEDFLARFGDGDCLPLDALEQQMPGMQRRILRAWWQRRAPLRTERGLSSAQTDEFVSLIAATAGARCNLPGGWHGQRGWTHLHLIPAEKADLIPEMPAADCMLLTEVPFHGEYGDGRGSQAIPRAWLAECTVRSRRTGDFIRPFGMDGTQSLQDYFTNRRVDAPFRDHVPLLCRGSEVLLAGGVGAGDISRCDGDGNYVLLRWAVTFPWQWT